mgnify:CR=1 FL=1
MRVIPTLFKPANFLFYHHSVRGLKIERMQKILYLSAVLAVAFAVEVQVEKGREGKCKYHLLLRKSGKSF